VSDRHEVSVTITNRLGLHARPAMVFADLARGFDATVRIRKADEEVDGTAIMEIMMLAATEGTKLDIIVTGPDAERAAAALTDLVRRGFDEV
jgi:phosphocarrier protein HPr